MFFAWKNKNISLVLNTICLVDIKFQLHNNMSSVTRCSRTSHLVTCPFNHVVLLYFFIIEVKNNIFLKIWSVRFRITCTNILLHYIVLPVVKRVTSYWEKNADDWSEKLNVHRLETQAKILKWKADDNTEIKRRR